MHTEILWEGCTILPACSGVSSCTVTPLLHIKGCLNRAGAGRRWELAKSGSADMGSGEEREEGLQPYGSESVLSQFLCLQGNRVSHVLTPSSRQEAICISSMQNRCPRWFQKLPSCFTSVTARSFAVLQNPCSCPHSIP